MVYSRYMGNQKNEAAGYFSPMVDTAFLICTRDPGESDASSAYSLMELASLVDTMGFEVLGSSVVTVKAVSPRHYIGSGQAEEIMEQAKDLDVDCIIFDGDLSPSQQRNWENESGICVIDRHEVILDIFARRASTREATLQVALARMEYSLPRLTRAWTHLSRQRGGSKGTRGEGETQLEVDRRIVLRKIAKLKKELEQVRLNRDTLRKQRLSKPVPTASIVGYTNAGKSSLLKSLTGADVFVEDKLFATLDPVTKRIKLKGGNELLLTDTVGFIRRLPHDLVDAFKSTLEETLFADFLIHVLDASSPEVESHYETTMAVLKELGAADKEMITVFNKMDLCGDAHHVAEIHAKHPDGVFVSVKDQSGYDELFAAIEEVLYKASPTSLFRIPSARHDLAALVHRTGKVLRETYLEDAIEINAYVPPKTMGLLKEYLSS